MARDAATVQAEIDAIRAAMARGVQVVRHGETETRYFSPSEMQKALDSALAEFGKLSGIRQVRFMPSKGLD